MIINIPDKSIDNIIIVNFAQLQNKISLELLNNVTLPSLRNGVRRNNYYLIKTETIFKFSKLDKESYILFKLLERAFIKGYAMIMIKI